MREKGNSMKIRVEVDGSTMNVLSLQMWPESDDERKTMQAILTQKMEDCKHVSVTTVNQRQRNEPSSN